MDQMLEQAIEQLKNGEQQGFQILYDKTHNYVYMQARNFLKNESDANDLVQEVYINAYRSIHSLQENQKIYGWLCGITFRQATKLMRKQKEVLMQDEEEGIFENIVDFDEDIQPEKALDKKTSAQILLDLMDELPELQKGALLAYYYDEMSIGEIAEIYSCSEGTIKSRLNYARKSLKELIQKKEEKDGIKLYSFSLPLLLLALHMFVDTSLMDVKAAEIVCEKCLKEMDLSLNETLFTAKQSYAENIVTDAAEIAKNGIYIGEKFVTARALAVGAAAVLALGIGGGTFAGYKMAQKEYEAIKPVNEVISVEILDDTEELEIIETETTTEIMEETEEAVTEIVETEEAATEMPETEIQTESAEVPEPEPAPVPTPETEPTPAPEPVPVSEPTPEPAPAPEPAPEPTPAPEVTVTQEENSGEDEFVLDAPEVEVE
ncbi:MAG: RNA polymerase sigma factor [Lachnospiraceae bacterium]|nr:RNA polymerase sigma factor [Lachnospiraceae bacterium]